MYHLILVGFRTFFYDLWAVPLDYFTRIGRVMREIGAVVSQIRALMARLGMVKTQNVFDRIIVVVTLTLLLAVLGLVAVIQWYITYLRWITPRLFPRQTTTSSRT